jgi:hypothetical protein
MTISGTEDAGVARRRDGDFGRPDLGRFPPMLRPARRGRISRARIAMLEFKRMALVVLLLAAAAPARAGDPVTVNDTARFLAGMTPSANSPLAPLTQDPAWQHHARFFDAAFGQLEELQLSKIRAWAGANLAAPRPTMFYMFGGPDFLYADAFYSRATTYVLNGPEPAGVVSDPSRLSADELYDGLYNVERSMNSILNFSFFATPHTKKDRHRGEPSGILPILYVFLARSGKTIQDVGAVGLDENGAVHAANEDAGANATRGVRIIFAGSDGVERTLYYFSADLSNNGIAHGGFLKFCLTLAPGNSLLKNASYLLSSRNFTMVRDFLLANSATIIQDDSGIPLANYDPSAWRFFPFGRYAGPIAKFPGKFQSKYAELFQRSQPIDFSIGYRQRSLESNLLLSVKVAPESPGLVEAMPADEPLQKKPRARRVRPQEFSPGSLWHLGR